MTCVAQASAIKPRVAILGFAHTKSTDPSAALESLLAEKLGRDDRMIVVDQSMVQAASKGIGYAGSINLGKHEARSISAAIGCDFFIIGKTEALTRSERAGESHEAAYAAVMIVDGRTGDLASFDFVSETSTTREASVKSLLKSIDSRISGYVDRMAGLFLERSRLAPAGHPSAEFVEDMPREGSARAIGFTPPEFLNRARPEYTQQAELADITATVEALAVFGANGEVGRVEITRWAGFGLDQAAEQAIRQLKFKPATRDGKPISVRALIRYNFRRVTEATKVEAPAPEPPEKPERDLLHLFKPTYRRP